VLLKSGLKIRINTSHIEGIDIKLERHKRREVNYYET